MKKLFVLGMLSTLLCACYCHCTQTTAAPQVQPPAEQTTPAAQPAENTPAAPSTPAAKQTAPVQTAPTSAQAQPKPAAVKPQPTATAAATAATATTAATQPTAAAEPAAEEPPSVETLIANLRAGQTLKTPVADHAVFKKEELLPTTGRLLGPLSYEPILPDTTHAPWSNESLKYGVYYSFIKAGTAYIKTRGITQYNGRQAYMFQTTAFSASVIDSVFKVRDVNYSWLDVKDLHSLGYSQSVREGNYVRDEWVMFDPAHKRYLGEVQKKKGKKTISGTITQEVLDMLSSLYFVRAKPLQVGKDITFDIVNREQQYPLVVKVLGKETVKTQAGKFNCWVVEPQFRGEGIFVAKGKSLKVWITDDQYRMPVKMEVEVFIGSVSAELLEYKRN
ncbi:MAG: DUF3108 domain-containing protein [Elusimicrobiaceae bacterium]|nr:DUF3108 domain-containing protein [Elusimicrobiaceae bacterium]